MAASRQYARPTGPSFLLVMLIVATVLTGSVVQAQESGNCTRHTTCSECVQYTNCGWCGRTGTCMQGSRSGSSGGTCTGGWAFDSADCGDPCLSATTCASCTNSSTASLYGCGWCTWTASCRMPGAYIPGAACALNNWYQVSCPVCPADATTCQDCTQISGCGWCDNRCVPGYRSGPLNASTTCSVYYSTPSCAVFTPSTSTISLAIPIAFAVAVVTGVLICIAVGALAIYRRMAASHIGQDPQLSGGFPGAAAPAALPLPTMRSPYALATPPALPAFVSQHPQSVPPAAVAPSFAPHVSYGPSATPYGQPVYAATAAAMPLPPVYAAPPPVYGERSPGAAVIHVQPLMAPSVLFRPSGTPTPIPPVAGATNDAGDRSASASASASASRAQVYGLSEEQALARAAEYGGSSSATGAALADDRQRLGL